MSSRGSLYGVAVVATALILLSATFGGYYYLQFSKASSNNDALTSELDAANANYTRLAANYNRVLQLYNETISLLSHSLAVMNTSDPAYQQASARLASLWQAYQELRPASASLLTNSVLFDYGNGTMVWYNDTAMQPGWNMYIETLVLSGGQLTATWYPQFGEHFVSGIGGVSDNQTMSWFLWTYTKSNSWQAAQVGADLVQATSGSVYAWTYCGEDQNYNPTCQP